MQTISIRTATEKAGKNRVKLRVEVPEEAFKPALDEVYRRWANQIKVPGFRKGKVPRQIIDTRVGADTVREEALEQALPDFYREAIKNEDLEPIAAPEIDVVTFERGRPIIFEATVDLRPKVELPDLSSLTVEGAETEATDQEVDEQLERLRDRFAELETVPRDARRGDFVLIDLNGSRHGQPVEGASQPDLLYEVGSNSGPPKLDAELEGARPGVIAKFTDVMPEGAGDLAGEELSFTVLVKEVKAKKLPALDDEFAKTVGEFDALADLKDDLRSRISEFKKGMAVEENRRRALAALVEASDLEPPERLVDEEFEHRWHHFEDELKRAGLSMADYEQQSGTSLLDLRAELRRQAARSVKAELLVEELARRAEVEVTEQDLLQEITAAASQMQRDPGELAQELTQSGRLRAVAADIMRRKALAFLVDNVNLVGGTAEEENEGDGGGSKTEAGAGGE
jgi:trigger factor